MYFVICTGPYANPAIALRAFVLSIHSTRLWRLARGAPQISISIRGGMQALSSLMILSTSQPNSRIIQMVVQIPDARMHTLFAHKIQNSSNDTRLGERDSCCSGRDERRLGRLELDIVKLWSQFLGPTHWNEQLAAEPGRGDSS